MNALTPELIREAIRAYLNAPNWETARQVIETQQHVLLHPAAEVGFEQIIAMQIDEKLVQQMEQHLALLRRSREVGVDAAFTNPEALPNYPSAEALAIAIGGFIRTEECEDTLMYLRLNHRLLLHPDADSVFEALIDQAQDEEVEQLLNSHYAMVQSCREYGIDEGFARVKNSVWPDEPDPPPYEEIMQAVVGYVNTPDWQAARMVVEQAPELLLGLGADIVFAQIIASRSDDGTEKLNQYRQVLAWARTDGIDVAFERAAETFLVDVAPQHIAMAIAQFAQTSTWEEAHQVFETHQELLLSPLTSQIFDHLIDIAQRQGQHDMVEALEDHHLVCQWASEYGVDEAFRRAEAEL